MAAKVIEIDNCDGCPFFGNERFPVCYKAKPTKDQWRLCFEHKLSGRVIPYRIRYTKRKYQCKVRLYPIPNWCPLKNGRKSLQEIQKDVRELRRQKMMEINLDIQSGIGIHELMLRKADYIIKLLEEKKEG